MTPPGTSAPPSAPASGPGERIPGLDALRGGALLLGIMLHALLPFIVVPGAEGQLAGAGSSWLIADDDPRGYALPVIGVIHLFRLTVFFVLSGYFGHLVVSRRGMRRYLAERFIRIALPVFAFWPFAVLPLGLIAAAWSARHGVVLAQPASSGGFPTGQLWFLWVLFQCCLLLAAVRAVARRLAPALAARIAGRAAAVLAGPWGAVAMSVPYAAAQLWQAQKYAGITQPATLLPEPAVLLAYSGAFTAGWLLWRRPAALREITGRWRAHLLLAVLSSGVTLYLSGLSGLPAPGGGPYLLSVISALSAWAWTYGLLGACVQHLGTERRWVRYLADASYWMYLTHLPLLTGIAALLTSAPVPAEVKLLITLTATTLILLLSYDGFVRSTWIGRWLSGHRRERVIFARSRQAP